MRRAKKKAVIGFVRYRCKKAFQLKELGENKYLIVNKNTLWEKSKSTIKGTDVRLEQYKNKTLTRWLELTKEELEEYFEEVRI